MEENQHYLEIKERVGWGEEFNFYYNDKQYWISQNDPKKRYLTKVEGSETQEFESTEELFLLGRIEGKSLLELWDEIEQYF